MTNYERIKNMAIDEMADTICNFQTGCGCCRFYVDCLQSREMGIGARKWLESEASTEGEESK